MKSSKLFMDNSIQGQHADQTQTVEKRPEMTIVGIECRTSNAPETGPKDIGNLWQRFAQENVPSQISNRASEEVIALYCDYEGDHTQPYTCVIGCEVNSVEEIPEGMVVKTIPKSTYKKFPSVGEQPMTLINTWQQIWELKDLKRTYSGDFEVYGKGFYSIPSEIDVYIAIEDEL